VKWALAWPEWSWQPWVYTVCGWLWIDVKYEHVDIKCYVPPLEQVLQCRKNKSNLSVWPPLSSFRSSWIYSRRKQGKSCVISNFCFFGWRWLCNGANSQWNIYFQLKISQLLGLSESQLSLNEPLDTVWEAFQKLGLVGKAFQTLLEQISNPLFHMYWEI
jgi:hypothetical protein